MVDHALPDRADLPYWSTRTGQSTCIAFSLGVCSAQGADGGRLFYGVAKNQRVLALAGQPVAIPAGNFDNHRFRTCELGPVNRP